MNVLELKDISKIFYFKKNNQTVFKKLNLQIKKSEVLAILGPSGCGKSTLLRILADLEEVSSGEIVRSTDCQELSYVFQEPRLIPWMSVEKNIRLSTELLGKAASAEQVQHWLDKTQLAGQEKKYPSQISGGMKMRTALARALIAEPKILLLDEPLSALDEWTKHQLQEDIRNFVSAKQITTVFVTHSISEAVFMADKILFMSKKGELQDSLNIEFKNKRNSKLRSEQVFFDTVNRIHGRFEQLVNLEANV